MKCGLLIRTIAGRCPMQLDRFASTTAVLRPMQLDRFAGVAAGQRLMQLARFAGMAAGQRSAINSVGQRPTKRDDENLKAVSLASPPQGNALRA